MRVLITGATGFVGREIVRQAHAAGHRLRILVRNPQAQALEELRLIYRPEVHAGDLLEPGSLEKALDGIDAVVHLVGIISEVGNNTFENAHHRATRNLVSEARRAKVNRFVHMSALGTRPDAVSRYHQTKWQAEEAIRASGLSFTIFRPSLIYGPEDHFVNLFARLARSSPVLPVMGPGRARFQPIAVDVVATAFVRALNEPKSIAHTFDLCGPEALTFPEILDQILSVTGYKRLKVRVPQVLARVQARFLESFFQNVLKKAPPLNRDQLVMLQEDNVGQGRPADELFGLKHQAFRDGIAKYLSTS